VATDAALLAADDHFSNGISTVALQHVPSNQGALLRRARRCGSRRSARWARGDTRSPCALARAAVRLRRVGLIVWPREAMATGQVGWQGADPRRQASPGPSATIVYRDASLTVGPWRSTQ